MSIKPSDIFIGVIDFFSVLLPGALLTYFLSGFYYGSVFGDELVFPVPTNEAARLTVFLIVSYIVGNLVFMLASFLDFGYNRFLRARLFCTNYDLTYKTATCIREKHLNTNKKIEELFISEKLSQSDFDEISDKSNPEIFNTFKWAQHFLLFNKPEALADIQRIVADSKFFRSLVVAFLIIAVLMFVKIKILLGVIFTISAIFCYYRYGDLRHKSTEKAYEMIITFFHLETEKAKADKEKAQEHNREKLKNELREEIRNEPKKESPVKPEVEIELPKMIQTSGLKRSLDEDFSVRNQEKISFLTKGIAKPLKLMTLGADERRETVFISDKNESWYCLNGFGMLKCVRGNETEMICLMPNQIIPIKNTSEISFSGDEIIEFLVIED